MVTLTQALNGRHHIQIGNISVDILNLWALLGLWGAIVVAVCISVSNGTTSLTFFDVLQGLFGVDLGADKMFAIFENRFPRIVMAMFAGFMVAVVGALLQSLAQNPLADPGILGLSQGSILTIMLVIVLYPNAPPYIFPISGMAGAFIVGGVLLALVGKNNQGGIAILLMGIAVETTLSSVISVLILHTPVEISYQLQQWAMGSLVYSSWKSVYEMSWWMGLVIICIIVLGRRLRVYDLGDQVAVSLGEKIRFSKPVLVFFAVALTAYSVSAVGPLTFLGILAPNLADFITRSSGAMRLVLAGSMGAFILILADFLTRKMTLYMYMPVGMTLVIVGVPLFVLTLRIRYVRQRRNG